MTGKILVLVLAATAVLTAGAVFYLQVFYYYEDVAPEGFTLVTDAGEIDAEATGIEAIDANSSPIRFRACFDTTLAMDVDAVPFEEAVPLNAPFWFECFDADALGAALAEGSARAYLGQRNVDYGADQIIAITESGRGYVWHQLNACGEQSFDGTQDGQDCPTRED